MDWILEVVCGLIIITSFLMQTNRLAQELAPVDYPWWLFLLGFIPGCLLFIWRFVTQPRS
jgi:hypothetical protein